MLLERTTHSNIGIFRWKAGQPPPIAVKYALADWLLVIVLAAVLGVVAIGGVAPYQMLIPGTETNRVLQWTYPVQVLLLLLLRCEHIYTINNIALDCSRISLSL